MKEINLDNEYGIRSCNSCGARNYKSLYGVLGKQVEKLYSLDVGQMNICLCEECLRELSAIIERFLGIDHPTEKGGVSDA